MADPKSQKFFKTVKVIERSLDVTPRSKYDPVTLMCCNSDYYFWSYTILENKMARAIFLWSAAILKVSVEPNRFSNLP